MNLSGCGCFFLFTAFLAQAAWAVQPPPISISAFGIYGSPVQPQFFASSTKDAAGFEALGEWNPISYASLGLSYETTTFFTSPSFVLQTASLEGRLFPLENGRGKFSPYIMGGAGLNLGEGGNLVLKAGLGSRVAFIGPTFLDLMVGSHWIQDPGSFQYVDARLGMSFSFDLNGSSASSKPAEQQASASKPAAKTEPVATAVPTAVVTVGTPTVTPTVMASPTATSTPQELVLEETAPVSPKTLSGSVAAVKTLKKYYKLGMQAFIAGKYNTSLKYLKRSLAVKEVHGAAYYYAETYSTIGVIYHFHSKVKNHKKLALYYYKKALKIDPTTKAAKKYIKRLLPAAKAKPRPRHKPTPVPTDTSIDMGASQGTTASSGN